MTLFNLPTTRTAMIHPAADVASLSAVPYPVAAGGSYTFITLSPSAGDAMLDVPPICDCMGPGRLEPVSP